MTCRRSQGACWFVVRAGLVLGLAGVALPLGGCGRVELGAYSSSAGSTGEAPDVTPGPESVIRHERPPETPLTSPSLDEVDASNARLDASADPGALADARAPQPGAEPARPDAGDADRRSCSALPRCGPRGDSCCTRFLVPAGTFQLGQTPEDAGVFAAAQSFYLDQYEVTTARFARFIDAFDAWRADGNPRAGAAEYNGNPETGWQERWNTALAASAAELRANARACSNNPFSSLDVVDSAPDLPMNCVSWYEAFAFCAWDAGRLPTELEWEYAARGGSEQRRFPWGDSADGGPLPPVSDRVAFNCARPEGSTEPCSFASLPAVGSFPLGRARWLQLDMAGSLTEWVFDGGAPYPDGCTNCSQTNIDSRRMVRGGSWYDPWSSILEANARNGGDPAWRNHFVGFRCASTEYR